MDRIKLEMFYNRLGLWSFNERLLFELRTLNETLQEILRELRYMNE